MPELKPVLQANDKRIRSLGLTLGYGLAFVYVAVIALVGVFAGAYAVGIGQVGTPILAIGIAAIVWKGKGATRAEHSAAAQVGVASAVALVAVILLVAMTGPHEITDPSGTHWVWINGH